MRKLAPIFITSLVFATGSALAADDKPPVSADTGNGATTTVPPSTAPANPNPTANVPVNGATTSINKSETANAAPNATAPNTVKSGTAKPDVSANAPTETIEKPMLTAEEKAAKKKAKKKLAKGEQPLMPATNEAERELAKTSKGGDK